jgi:hypothetical protein
MTPEQEIILVLARIKEYKLRGELDKGLQDLRWELNRAIALMLQGEEK